MTLTKIVAALAVAALFLAGCSDEDGASVRDLGGSASSGSGHGSGSASGTASGSEAECAGASERQDDGVEVVLDEYTVTPEDDELEGVIAFKAVNKGETAHELYVVQAPNLESLPLSNEGNVDVDALEPGRLIAELENVPPGGECVLEADLDVATYVLFCNIVEGRRSHYLSGMRARVKVRGS